jgi:hypothetical protein
MQMKRTMLIAGALAVAVAMSLAIQVNAAPKEPNFDRVDGWIKMIDQDESKISLRVSPDTPRYVFYDNKTHFTYRNEPSSFDEVKVGRRVICVGKFDDQGRMHAERIDVRLKN